MGRKRKPLEEKSTALMLRINNKILFDLCDRHGIEVDKNGLIIDDDARDKIIDLIKENISKM